MEKEWKSSTRQDTTDLYIEEIHKIPLLTFEEEQELGIKIKNGDNYAINKMVEHNLRLVIPIARYYMNRGIDFNDLIQYGNLGLITAAEKYDVTKGTRFSTYAVQWIRQKISRAIAEYSRNIRLPDEVYRTVQKYNAQKQKLEKIKGYKLSYEELEKELNITIDEIRYLEKLSQDTVSLNTKIEAETYEGADSLQDIICDEYILEDEVINEIRDEEIIKIIKKIVDNPLYINILLDKYNCLTNETCKSLAIKYEMSESDIKKILKKTMKKIRSSRTILNFIIYSLNEEEAIRILQPHNPYIKMKIK